MMRCQKSKHGRAVVLEHDVFDVMVYTYNMLLNTVKHKTYTTIHINYDRINGNEV